MPGNTKQPPHLQFQKGSDTKHSWVYKHIIQIRLQYRLPFQIVRSSWQIRICVLQSPELVTEKSCQDLNIPYITLWLRVFTGEIIYQPQHHRAMFALQLCWGKGGRGLRWLYPSPATPARVTARRKGKKVSVLLTEPEHSPLACFLPC